MTASTGTETAADYDNEQALYDAKDEMRNWSSQLDYATEENYEEIYARYAAARDLYHEILATLS